MSIKERLIEFTKSKNIPTARFERTCGMSNGYINSIKKSPGVEKLDNILRAYPTLNKDWLITGNGSMTNTNTLKNEQLETTYKKDNPKSPEIATLEKTIFELKKEIETLKKERHTLINSNSRLSRVLQDVIYKAIKTDK